jgi:Holliday junction resolvase RusA-like endonuclease
MKTVELTISGRPIVKKNNKNIFYKDGKINVRSKKSYYDYRKVALQELEMLSYTIGKLEPPYQISYNFNMKGKEDSDIDNMIATINDILQDAGYIINDKLIISIGESNKIPGCSDWKTHIKITDQYAKTH